MGLGEGVNGGYRSCITLFTSFTTLATITPWWDEWQGEEGVGLDKDRANRSFRGPQRGSAAQAHILAFQ